MERAHDAVEMLDRPAPFLDLSQNLEDIARFNAFFGGTRLTLRHVKGLVADLPRDRSLTLPHVGTRGGDIPRALVRGKRRTQRSIRILALDRKGAKHRAPAEHNASST